MAFASGCLFHKPAHAAAVVVVGTLLICFLPIVFPPLERFSVGGVLDENALEIAAVSGLLGIAIVTALLGLLSVRFHWHIESGKPLIYGAICSGFLVLALSASYQLGTNLPVISTTELPKGEVAEYVEVGKASTSVYLLPVGADGQPSRSAAERLLMLSNDSLGLGAVSPIDDRRPTAQSARNERDPSIIYNLWMEWEADRQVWQLAVLRNPGIHEFSNIATIDLWIAPENDWTDRAGYFDQFSDRLNVIVGKRLIVFDVSDPPRPRKITDEAFPWQLSDENIGEDVAVPLPPVPGLPGEERLKFLGNIMNLSSSRRFDGRNLLLFSEPAFEVLRLKSVNDDRALFRRAGRYTPTIVQSIAVHNSASRRGIVNGMLYAETGNLLSVFDISRDGPVKLIAHFAAPGVQFYQPLPDGRVLAGGSKIWLLGPPPKH
jgi:hypothetical protein